jgi:hypothetical protein
MTFMTLRILTYQIPLPKEELENYALNNPVFENLDNYARDCTTALSRWARERKLPVYYVDNCWERVPVTAEELRSFYREVLPAARVDPNLDKRVIDNDHYLIESEEF